MAELNLQFTDYSWRPLIENALQKMDSNYIQQLSKNPNWLPGPHNIFNAFSLPLPQTKYILFGESPYPRAQSANGYAFWDGQVHELWSSQGLAKKVNRATSLRNIIKMLLVARGELQASDTTQQTIAAINKQGLVSTIDELFSNFLAEGILLLNASLVLSDKPAAVDAKLWQPFVNSLLEQLTAQLNKERKITLILFGKIANLINAFPSSKTFPQFCAEHPYNLSFITNPSIIHFFMPFNLLAKKNPH